MGSLRFANLSTCMLKLVELRMAGGWPRLERLGFINSGTCVLKFTELRWQVGRWLDKGGDDDANCLLCGETHTH